MRTTLCALFLLAALCPPAKADPSPYERAKSSIASDRQRLAQIAVGRAESRRQSQRLLLDAFRGLTAHWLGTPWGLGAPQTRTPQVGKVNCGTFVGLVLADLGFVVNVRKLQRQPSQLIIKSFVGGRRVRKFSNRSMDTFLASVREMGPGLYIIGLDFHVGFLLQTETDLRFIHASFETGTVVDEAAATAMPIATSNYRVVGKILSPRNLDDWLDGRRIAVKGNY